MATRISMVAAKKVPLHMISRGSRVVGGAIRPFSSIENTYKKLTSANNDDWDRIATQIDYIAQKVHKIEQQLRRHRPPQEEKNILEQWKLSDSELDGAFSFNYIHPEYHDPKLPEFSAIAKRALDTYNLSQVTKLELVEVATAYTIRGEDNTHIVIEAKPCNPATDSNSQPQVIYEGVILSKDEKFEEPIKPAKNLNKNDHQSKVIVHRYKEGKGMCEQTIDNDKSSQVGIQINEFPVYHDPTYLHFASVARRAIHSYNLGQHHLDSKLELIKVTSAFTKSDDKTCLVIEARTCNTPDSQPVIYKGLVSFWDEKLEELIPVEPGELKL